MKISAPGPGLDAKTKHQSLDWESETRAEEEMPTNTSTACPVRNSTSLLKVMLLVYWRMTVNQNFSLLYVVQSNQKKISESHEQSDYIQ